MVADMFLQDEIRFDPVTHQYFNQKNEEYASVSRCLKRLQVPFDREGISRRMAYSIASETGVSVEQAQKELLSEWNENKESSIDKGNYVHDGLEDYAKTGKVWESLEEPVAYMQNIFKQYYRFYPEVLLFSHKYKVAGRTDLILQRQKSKIPVFDITDYKSNEKKGIVFDSISRKESELKHYNRYLLEPFEYLESCNYVLYALQLSIYAFLLLDRGNCRIGKLAIIFFDNQFKPTYIPVPFMYQEAKMICELNTVIKDLPEWKPTEKIIPRFVDQTTINPLTVKEYPMTPDEAFQIKDDWD